VSKAFTLECGGILVPLGEGQTARLGRDPTCEIMVGSPTVSRLHASFTVADGSLWVNDLGSRNGVYVNGQRVRDRTRLQVGDRVVSGEITVSVTIATRSVSSRPPPEPIPRAPLEITRETEQNLNLHEVFIDAARQALDEGRFVEATDALTHCLEAVELLPRPAQIDPKSVEGLTRAAITLAEVREDAAWLERLLRFRRLTEAPVDTGTTREVSALLEELPVTDDSARRAYVEWLRTVERDPAAIAALDELATARGRE
jgi:predicted component of type VI protein secretion system